MRAGRAPMRLERKPARQEVQPRVSAGPVRQLLPRPGTNGFRSPPTWPGHGNRPPGPARSAPRARCDRTAWSSRPGTRSASERTECGRPGCGGTAGAAAQAAARSDRLAPGHRPQATALLADGVKLLAKYQDRLAAQYSFGVLLVLQGLDTSGKDSTIKHVMSCVNPQPVAVRAFKQPSAEELNHDFLWRYQCALPGRGRIGIFNRSHYEEVLVVRVHQGPARRAAATRGGNERRRLGPPVPEDQRLGALSTGSPSTPSYAAPRLWRTAPRPANRSGDVGGLPAWRTWPPWR